MRSTLLISLILLLAACGGKPAVVRDAPPKKEAVDPWEVPPVKPEPLARSRYGNPKSYEVLGKRYYVLDSSKGYKERGFASWYGSKFHGRRTSSGEPYDMYAMTAAHKTLPIPCWVRVTNLENGRQLILKVNDRGPFHKGRIIDLSYTAAVQLGVYAKGFAKVEVEALNIGEAKALAPIKAPAKPVPTEPITSAADAAALNQLMDGFAHEASAPSSSGYFIQLEEFSQKARCQSRWSQLREGDFPQIKLRENSGSDKLCRLLLGPYEHAEAAELKTHELRAQFPSATLIRE